MTMMIVFNKAVGKTTTPSSPIKPLPTSTPIMNNGIDKNTIPLIIVPIAVSIGALNLMSTPFLMSRNSPKNTNAATGFSTMLAISPPGNIVVSAAISPVTTDKSKTYWNLGKSKIPKNIIANNKSGVTPKIGGATRCKTAPIPTNNDKMTKTLVFICKLSSSQLFYSQLYTLCQLRKIHYQYNKFCLKLKGGD